MELSLRGRQSTRRFVVNAYPTYEGNGIERGVAEAEKPPHVPFQEPATWPPGR